MNPSVNTPASQPKLDDGLPLKAKNHFNFDASTAGFKKLATAAAMLGASLPALAETAPNAPTATSVAATNPETQDINASTLQRHLELRNGAGVDVAMGKTSMLVRGNPSAEVMAEANGQPVELIIAAATPVDGEKQPQIFKYMDRWQPLGAESDYYAFDDIPLSVSLGDLSAYKGIVYYIGYGIGKTAEERLQYTLSHGAFDNVPMTPLNTIASFKPTNLAIPGQMVESEPLDISTIVGPVAVAGVGGAEVMAIAKDGTPGHWGKSVMIDGKQKSIQLRGKTANAFGVTTQISATVNEADQIAWQVTNKKAPEAVKTPEITQVPKTVNVESLSTNKDTPKEIKGSVIITIPSELAGKKVNYVTLVKRSSDGSTEDSSVQYTGEPILPSNDLCKMTFRDEQGEILGKYYFVFDQSDAKK